MKLYTKYILPRIVHFACSSKPAMRQRQIVVPQANGIILEVGIGTGLNIPYYSNTAIKVWGLDPSYEMTRLAQKAANISSVDVEFINQSCETLPLEDSVVDTILMTYTLCSIPDTKKALNQMIRVLKPSGKLIFCEHGVSPDMNVLQWQDRLNPVWKALGGGCHLNRNIPKLIEDGGFKIKQIHTYYLPGWKFASYNFQGVAVPL